jgi:hypothetical protein
VAWHGVDAAWQRVATMGQRVATMWQGSPPQRTGRTIAAAKAQATRFRAQTMLIHGLLAICMSEEAH